MSMQEQLKKGIRRILAENDRYAFDAYLFVQEAVSFTMRKQDAEEGAPRHISGHQLLEGARDVALDLYGPLAGDVWRHWGITKTEDIGHIVFAMVEHRLLGASESDSLSDFDDVFDFDQAFLAPYLETESSAVDLEPVA